MDYKTEAIPHSRCKAKRFWSLPLLLTVVMMSVAVCHVCAQKLPVGIVSTQDSVKSIQVSAISPIATDGGRGLQLSAISNMSALLFNGLQL